jgi:hypothetical protein
MNKHNLQEKLILISISNIIFLKNWVSLGVFNFKDNYYSLNGIDKNFFLLQIILFCIFVFLIFSILNNFKNKNFILFIKLMLLLLALNVLRSVSNFEFLSLTNKNFLISCLIILVTSSFFLIKKKIVSVSINFIFKCFGLTLVPFLFFVYAKILFGMIYLKSYDKNFFENRSYLGKVLHDNSQNKVLWIIFDQLDQSILLNNLDQLPSFKYILSKSDVYKNFNPGSFETIRSLPALYSGINKNENYKFYYHNRNIELLLGDDNNKYKFLGKDSLFNYASQKNHTIYVNSWYIPACKIFFDYLNKCFQVAYGEQQTLDFFNIKELILLNITNIVPGLIRLIDLVHPKNKIFEKINIKSQNYYWYLKSFEKKEKDFLNEIKENKNSFIFLHSIIPHPPIIYNKDKKKLYNNYKEMINKNNHLKKDNILLLETLDNFVLADNLLGKTIQILKNKKEFNNYTIIINGDTGLSEKFKNSDNLTGSTILFIKKPHQTENQNINSYVDILAAFNLIKDVL